MSTYYTIEEKYLKAIEKADYGRMPKALRLLKEIIENDPLHARAHFTLGKIYYYDLCDYQSAGFHFKTCMGLEPSFPDNYIHYLNLVVFLNMEKLVYKVKEQALTVPGVDAAAIHDNYALFHEKNKRLEKALAAYQTAFIEVTSNTLKTAIEESITRVKAKIAQSAAFKYSLVE